MHQDDGETPSSQWGATDVTPGGVWPETPARVPPPAGPTGWGPMPARPPEWGQPPWGPPAGGPPSAPRKLGRWALLIVAVTFAFMVVTVVVIAPKLNGTSPGTPADAALPTAPSNRSPSTTAEDPGAGRASGAPPSTAAPTTTAPRVTTTIREPSPAEYLREDLTAAQLQVPPKPANQGEANALFKSTSGKPAGFNPCKTINYTVNVGAGPRNGLALVQEAVRRVEAATGLRFNYAGPNNSIPQVARRAGGIADLGTAFNPIFIGWATSNETNIWALEGGDALGVTSPEVLTFDSGDQLFVSGAVVLSPTSGVSPTFGPGATAGNVLLHELGHLVGLDHVSDQSGLMVPLLSPQSPDGYGPGDRRGLWTLGASRGCASAWLKLR
ncbi:MAG: matrixin family metalloprotease [Actinobacteria bacterium]|nr:matrixin family metalloprotease [Actinomycetota bacterium]